MRLAHLSVGEFRRHTDATVVVDLQCRLTRLGYLWLAGAFAIIRLGAWMLGWRAQVNIGD